ncbi:hypothetical protein QOT17_011917 [Balamuthia mandrillaris]
MQQYIASARLFLPLLLLSFNFVLLVSCQSEDVYVRASSSCVSGCTESSPYKSIQDFLTDYDDAIWMFSSFTFHFLPGVHPFPDGFTLGQTHSMNFLGEGNDPSEVSLQTCGLELHRNTSFQGVTLQNKNQCGGELVFVYTTTLQLDNVVVTNPVGKGVAIHSAGTMLTADVAFSSVLEDAVMVRSVSKWHSFGCLIIENIPSETSTAVAIVDSSTWIAFGPVHVANVARLAINVRQTSEWTSHDEIVFEYNDNPVWITESSSWQQKGEVIFRQNREVAVTHEVDGIVRANLVLLLARSNWTCKAPVRFINNGPVSSSLITLQNDCSLQSYFTFVVEGLSSSPLFTCTNSKLITNEPCTFECGSCEQLSAPLPVVSWSIDPSYLRLDGHVVLLSVPDPVFSIRVASKVDIDAPFGVAIVTDGRKGSRNVDLGDGVVTIAPGTEHIDFAFSVLSFNSSSSASPFSILLQSVDTQEGEDEQPTFFLSGDQSRVEVVLHRTLQLPSLSVHFPFGTPDLLLTPRSSSASSSLLSSFSRLIEVNGETGEEVRSISIAELSWQTSLSPSSSSSDVVSFSSSFNDSYLQFAFLSLEEGKSFTLQDGTIVPPFDSDLVKWSIRVANWSWSNEEDATNNNQLALEITLLNVGESNNGWSNFQEETVPLEEDDDSKQLKLFRFSSEELEATLRALSFVWIDQDHETAVPIQLQATQEEQKSEWTLRLTFPHFERELEYDPDLSVLLGEGATDEGDGADDGVDQDNGGAGGDGSDQLWWKVTVPLLLVALVAVVVGVAIVFHLKSKGRLASRNKTLARVRTKSAELGSD